VIFHQLEDIINKSLEKDRELRYQHASDIRTDLKRLKRETESWHGIPASSGSVVVVAQEGASQVTEPPSPPSGSSPALAPSPSSSVVTVTEVPVAGRKLWRVLVPAGVILATALIAGGLYWRSRSAAPVANAAPLTERDTVVLADFTNTTSDPVFDGTLKQALAVDLEQSPFLNILSDRKVGETLRLMGASRVTASRRTSPRNFACALGARPFWRARFPILAVSM